jgi:hypothetical protein
VPAVGAPVVRDRQRHSATTLENGDILIAGGTSATAGGAVAQAELYEPGPQRFTATGSLLTPRARHTATRLGDGTVLVAGGEAAAAAIAAPEIYTPATGQFTAAPGTPLTARRDHSATLAANGTVLVAGGEQGGQPLASIERYVGGASGFAPVGSLLQARTRHMALRLENGSIWVAGGTTGAGGATPTASIEVLDSVSGLPRPARSGLAVPRAGASATFLPGGSILICGGFGVGGTALDSGEVYDPRNEKVVASVRMSRARGEARVARVFDGRVLVVGGDATADIFDTISGVFVVAASALGQPRTGGHSLTPLGTADVLVFGGGPANAPAELFDPR